MLCGVIYIYMFLCTYSVTFYVELIWNYLMIHVWLFAVKQRWSEPAIKGSPPTPRDSHSCTVVGDNLFVFGGTDGTNMLNDLHILDTCESLF